MAVERTVRLYIHPLDYSSYRTFMLLYEMGVLEKITIVNAVFPGPSSVLRRGLWGVPWIEFNGKPVAVNPISVDELLDLVQGTSFSPPKPPVDLFVDAVKSNILPASLVLLHGSLYPVVDENLAMAATRSILTGVDVEQVLEEIADRERELYADIESNIASIIAYNYLWDKEVVVGVEEEEQKLTRAVCLLNWLIGKASIGSTGIPHIAPQRSDLERRVNLVRKYLEVNWEGILRKVRRELETIRSDEEYWRMLAAVGLTQAL